ncbi:MAG TPA: ABC-F family ATP-binding cassette domain-containing protein [Candidatus Paceibacterota bacterium]
MIIVKKLAKSVLGDPLFEGVSFALHKGDKVGLVGPNGCGKSTLMKIILGLAEGDSGDIRIEGERIGYLAQEHPFKPEDSVQSVLAAREPDAKDALKKVGLDKVASDMPVQKLSGGQRTRLALAKILLSSPSALFLDEPTNHLDVQGLAWLEKFIEEFKGIVLVISHDRKLLDNSVHNIFEIDPMNHSFVEYQGGYSEYRIQKEKSFERQEDSYWRQQKEKKRLELWLALKRQEARVHPDPSKGKQIRAMEKRLEREIYSQEIAKPRADRKIRGMELSGEADHAKLIVRCREVAKTLGGRLVLRNISLEIRGEERVLLSGQNGSGKTTLLRIISGELPQDKGEVKIGKKVRIGYFAQEHEGLDLAKTVKDEFLSTERMKASERDWRAILGAFHFRGEDVFKKVSDLSSGERVRLIFAKLTNQENELLILDEPTNHLDIASREIIEDALVEYKGAILAVSHDRYFVDRIGFERVVRIENGVVH